MRKLDEMLGGGLLPGTLTVVYGATGIGKTHLGLTFADHGRVADGARGVVLDMNGRGDSQQHPEYATRLFDWPLGEWTHTVTPMADPYPPPDQMDAYYSNALRWVGRVRDFQVPTPDGGWEFDWNWKATYNHALYTVRPFLYFHFAAGTRRVVVDGVEPMDSPADSIQFYMFDELYRKTIHRDAETLGMEICLPVWQHREFIDAHLYPHTAITTPAAGHHRGDAAGRPAGPQGGDGRHRRHRQHHRGAGQRAGGHRGWPACSASSSTAAAR